MPSHTAEILTRALLAKAPMFGKLEKAIKELSRIDIQDVMGCPSEYLGAVANMIHIDSEGTFNFTTEHEARVAGKRELQMEYLREKKRDPQFCGPFIDDVSTLIINVQKMWLELAKERPATRVFQLGQQFPELVLPMSFGMRFYFKKSEVDPAALITLRCAILSPDEAMRKRRSPTSLEHKTLQ